MLFFFPQVSVELQLPPTRHVQLEISDGVPVPLKKLMERLDRLNEPVFKKPRRMPVAEARTILMVGSCLLCLCVDLYGSIWSCVKLWSCVELYGSAVGLCMSLCFIISSLQEREMERLTNEDESEIKKEAVTLAEQSGIVVIDEIDKICQCVVCSRFTHLL